MEKYSLPNLTTNEKIYCRYNILNSVYFFEFTWCDFFCLLDIYDEKSGEKNYLVKGIPVVTGQNLIDRTHLPDKLTIENIYQQKFDPSRENFHTDYELVWYESGDI